MHQTITTTESNISTTVPVATECPYCGKFHGSRCPEVRAIEYFKDGTVKRVEFVTPGDWLPRLQPETIQPHPWPNPWDPVWIGTTTAGYFAPEPISGRTVSG